MDDSRNVLEALEALDPSRLSYDEWIEVGMALKAEGHPCSVWDDWSSRDRDRYIPGDCEKRWQSFNSTGVGGGTIVHLAQTYSNYTPVRALSWDDGLDAYYEEVLTVEAKPREQPWQMAVRYLETLFQPDEKVSFVNQSVYKDKQSKWVPMNGGHVRKCSDLIADLKKYKELNSVFGTINPEAGAWIRFNPTTGPNDKDVTRFAYSLVESGGKSVHAIVKIDASDEAEYKQRVSYLYDQLAKRGFLVDGANKNPARLSRLPGAQRNDKVQKLVATNIGCKDWKDWKDYLEGIEDDLPQIVYLSDQMENPPIPSPELIASILREGNKLIITGDSKSGKTCLSQELAVCIAEGHPWLGKFQCKQGRVLYLNLECQESSMYERFKAIYKAYGINMTKKGCKNIAVWNLRGHAIPLNKLSARIIRRCRNEGPFIAIIIDPLYKVQQGDENSAEAITMFCNALDEIAQETGSAVIYDHHHPKGSMADRKAIDRGAGSGVFARDADAIIDLSSLSPDREALERIGHKIKEGEKPLLMSFVLRDFKDVPDTPVWFKFPIHYIDKAGDLDGAPIEGSREDSLNKSSKRTSETERRIALAQAFDLAQVDGVAKAKDMVKFIDRSNMYRYLKEFSDEFVNENGRIRRIKS